MVGAPVNSHKLTLKFLCSYGGRILPRYPDGKLRYHGGETRVLSVDRSISFSGQFRYPPLRFRVQLGLLFVRVYLILLAIFVFNRAAGEIGGDVWKFGEPEVPIADGRSGRVSVDHLRRGSREPNRGIRPCRRRVAVVVSED